MQSPGRISLGATTGEVARLPGFAYQTQAPSNAAQGGIRGNLEANALNQSFFSQANFQIIQNAIRRNVYEKSGEIIDPVSSDDLFMTMRALYLQYGRNLPNQIPEQITELNERVTAWCVPKIVSEISMYKTYSKDIAAMPIPMSHPVSQSSAGTRSLPLKLFF